MSFLPEPTPYLVWWVVPPAVSARGFLWGGLMARVFHPPEIRWLAGDAEGDMYVVGDGGVWTHCAYVSRPHRAVLWFCRVPALFGARPRVVLEGDRVAKFLKRVQQIVRGKGKQQSHAEAEFADRYPALLEHLDLIEYGPGESRETSTLTLFREDGRWKCSLNDRDQGRSAFVTASTFAALLEAVEAGLQTDMLDWRAWRWASGDKRQKPKRG